MSLGRVITVDGTPWTAFPSGFVTHFARDEFGVLFVQGDGPGRRSRIARFSPMGTPFRSREAAFQALSDRDLLRLFRQSQASERSPEGGYHP